MLTTTVFGKDQERLESERDNRDNVLVAMRTKTQMLLSENE
jgi:hypothetical protein